MINLNLDIRLVCDSHNNSFAMARRLCFRHAVRHAQTDHEIRLELLDTSEESVGSCGDCSDEALALRVTSTETEVGV